MYFTIIQTLNRRPNYINSEPHHKVTKLKSKLSLVLGYLSCVLNNPSPGSPHLMRWAKAYQAWGPYGASARAKTNEG